MCVKFETLAPKKLYQLQKVGYFLILVFELKLNILGISAYNAILGLLCKKKSKLGIKKGDPVFKKKQ
jgi:hypothetical protein